MSRQPPILRWAIIALAVAAFPACDKEPASGSAPAPASAPASAPVPASASASASAPAPVAPPSSPRDTDPTALHLETRDDLLALFSITKRRAHGRDAGDFLRSTFGPGSPSHANQGNKTVAQHAIARAACLEGLRGIELQTKEQREACGGAENMVPIYRHGKPGKAKTCIDIFEFPNQPCELPVVWIAPVQAQIVCELQGKRLCAQEEWTLACRGDPEGERDSVYAYGDELDLAVCNTNKPNPASCDAGGASSAWRTCGTNTEPAGAFPRCRSRFGIFDQHGNVAEIMTRLDKDGHIYDQLKGSAFFYVDVARKHNERQRKGERETYPDHCAYDPRWHVERMNEAWHVNYHLGFRCCKTIR